MKANMIEADYDSVLKDMIKRDQNDSAREYSPLKIADDAILIDTGRMDLAEVVKTLAAHIGGKNVL